MPLRKNCLRRKKKHNTNKYGIAGVRRIYSPYNRFIRIDPSPCPRDKAIFASVPLICTYRNIGLSQKEKGYLISTCQSRSNRYTQLKNLAAKTVKENKIFTIYGSCNAVRKALIQRGWIEKIPPHHMNLSKIRNGKFSSKSDIDNELERLLLSNFVEKCTPNFIWWEKEEHFNTTIDMKKDCNTIINKLKTDALYTTKQGLCTSIQMNYWFYIENVAEVNAPRTYNTYNNSEIEEFVADYRITACTSLIKWILSMAGYGKSMFAEHGNIPIKIFFFALNRCKEYLLGKQNKDIDQPLKTISTKQWNEFLKKYYRIMTKDEFFETDKENKVILYLNFAKSLLEEIQRFRPQLHCEGYHNIWIIKPAHCSRGRGIRLASTLGVITNLLSKANSKYVIQKYIEKPLLIYDTKFDIRQYYLVTSTYPLVIWMYQDCYLKFSSQKYDIKNYHESIHLTNNAVQRKYSNCSERHYELPEYNMWELNMYKKYLNKIDKVKEWDHIIYPGMKKSIIGIMLSCQNSMSISKNRFELYGCDFILDEKYTPWLIEINSCPDLSHTTQVTAKICPAVIADVVKVVIDYAADASASTGKFECIYRQPMTVLRYNRPADLTMRGISLPSEYFYRGTVTISKFYDKLIDEHDIETKLNKLKLNYEDDTLSMKLDYDGKSIKIDQETYTHLNRSDRISRTAIMDQLEDMFYRVEHPKYITKHRKMSPKKQKTSSNTAENISDLSDINKLLNKYIKQMTNESIATNTKGLHEFNDNISLRKRVATYIENTSNISCDNSGQYILDIASKLELFVNQKEKQYLTDLQM